MPRRPRLSAGIFAGVRLCEGEIARRLRRPDRVSFVWRTPALMALQSVLGGFCGPQPAAATPAPLSAVPPFSAQKGSHRILPRIIHPLALLLILLATAGVLSPAAEAQQQQPGPGLVPGPPPQQRLEPTGESFGRWQLICTVPNDPAAAGNQAAAAQACFISQRFLEPNTQQPILIVTVGPFRSNPQHSMLVAMPLGIPLANGIRVSVDGREVSSQSFEVCRRDGCRAYLPLNDNLVNAFKAGNEATVSVQSSTGGAINVPFSLRGFTAGYAKVR